MRDIHALPGTDVVLPSAAGPLRMHVATHGRRNGGLPILMLHGLPTSSYLWHDVARDLEHTHQMVMPDLIGLGASERPAASSPYRLDSQARMLKTLLDHLDLEKVAVVGHDLGGAIAVHLAAIAPERVGALALVSSPVHASEWPAAAVRPLLAPVVGDLVGALGRFFPDRVRAGVARGLATSLGDEELSHYVEPLLVPGGGTALVRLVRSIDLAPVESSLRTIQLAPPPTLVMWGARDPHHSAAYGERLSREISGATWVPLADAGHLVPQEWPERVAEELSGFLAEAREAVLPA